MDRPPEIKSVSAEQQIAPEAQPFMLNCTATGHPVPEITWFKNNIYLNDTAHQYFLTNGSLYFETLPRSASGLYRCEANSILGRDVSQSINLTVACEYFYESKQ